MALDDKQKVRLHIQDNQPEFYLISDDEIDYLLEKNNNNIIRTSIDASKIILLNLAMRGDSQVDIFSIKGAKSAEQYRLALESFIKNPDLNPMLNISEGYAGGVSKEDFEANNSITDNITAPQFNKSNCCVKDTSWNITNAS
jgi:hypothetical protein